MHAVDYLYLLLPVALWPLVFIVFSGAFIYAMTCAALALAAFTLLRYRKQVFWRAKSIKGIAVFGVAGAVILYIIFFGGYLLAVYTGNLGYVQAVYQMIYASGSTIVIAVLLLVIGVCEEIYWRGGLQGLVVEKLGSGFKWAWIVPALYYAGVHIATLNPILAVAAFFVGLVATILARRYGIAASMIAHVVWIEAIIILLPVIHV